MRYGVVGLGHMGRYHVNVLGGIPEVSFIGVFDTMQNLFHLVFFNTFSLIGN